jgi:hypothetical protein
MKNIAFASLLLTVFLFVGCTEQGTRTRGVYMLVDTSGTYTEEVDKAQGIINYMLGVLQPGDSFAVARIDSGSFSEKDIIAKMTFDRKPSMSNKQKLAFKQKFDKFAKDVKGSQYTDISGGLLQATEFLNETGVGRKRIIIFSDMEEELKKGHVRDFPLSLVGFNVVALNVTKLRKDTVDPKVYLDRIEKWKKRVEDAGGSWRVVNDLERVERILEE